MFEKIIDLEDREQLIKIIYNKFSKANYKAAAYLLKKEFFEKNKNIVFYGAGLHTEKIIKYLSEDDKRSIVSIVDNNKIGKKIDAFLVKNINELKIIDFDFIVLSTDIHQKSMRKELADFRLSEDILIDIYDNEIFINYVLDIDFDGKITELARSINNTRNPLVFFSTAYQLNYIGLFEELHKHYDIFVVGISDYFSGSLKFNADCHNFRFLKLENLQEMLYLSSSLKYGKIICVHGWMDNIISALVLAYSKIPTFCMLIDILSSMFESSEEMQKLIKHNAQEEFFCEKICWLYSDGYIYKDNAGMLGSLLQKYGDRPAIQFSGCISDTNFIKKNTKLPKSGIKFVYAAGIHAKSDSNDCSFIHSSILKAVQVITSQGHQFHIYNAYDNGTEDKWPEYYEEMKKNDLFFYNNSLPYGELVEELKKFDVSISIFDFSTSVTKKDFQKYAFSTRLLAFIEAELPMINSVEVEYLGEILNKYEIGVSIQFNDIYNISSIIERINDTVKTDSFEKAKLDFSYKKNMSRLIKFIEQ